jgi:hypothetical protein
MRTRPHSTLLLLLLLAGLAAPLAAEVRIVRHDGPLPERPAIDPEPDIESRSLERRKAEKREDPSTFFILPFLKVDDLFTNGETTGLGIRNEAGVLNEVFVVLYPSTSTDPGIIMSRVMDPKEVWTLNLRGQTGTLPVDDDLYIRGWGEVSGLDGPISTDYFQLNPAQDFATGGQLVDFVGNELCQTVKVRFLVGGAFSGGTQLFFYVDQPLGAGPEDPPSVTTTAYREVGDVLEIITLEIFTNQYSFELNASDLVDGENFGSLDIIFENPGGGFVNAEYKADNRYSVSLKSVCLDDIMPML